MLIVFLFNLYLDTLQKLQITNLLNSFFILPKYTYIKRKYQKLQKQTENKYLKWIVQNRNIIKHSERVGTHVNSFHDTDKKTMMILMIVLGKSCLGNVNSENSSFSIISSLVLQAGDINNFKIRWNKTFITHISSSSHSFKNSSV